MKQLFTILGFVMMLPLCGQQEAAIWYFGDSAGLDFNGGAPIPLTDGVLATQEGCATIADATGNLLFYTDGITVWNRNHTPMPNGTGLNGHASSTQSGIIVPSPADPNQYFVFTVHQAGEPEGLQYNMVDMSLDGGLGDVTTKNVLLATPVVEKLTAVQHGNGTDIWVLAHGYGNDEFLAYRVTPGGLVTTPIISAVGISHPILYNGEGSRGYMKVSPDGQFLATASAGTAHVEVFRFDPFTGVVSNGLVLDNYFPPPPLFSTPTMYGVEFSSDSSKLYIGYTLYLNAVTSESSIHQFDMTNYDQAAMIASGIEIAPPQPIEIGALQLAIDGKIYVAQQAQPYLGTINNPNVQGVGANYVENSVALAGRLSRSGLPPFIQSFFIIGFQAQNFCLGDATEFTVTSSDPIVSISWGFGDGTTSTLENPTHTYAFPGTYTVSVTVTTASETTTEVKDIVITDTPVANPSGPVEGCTSYGSYNLDLPSFDSAFLGAQDPNDVVVSYHLTQLDADNNTNALTGVHPFDYGVTPVYVRVSSRDNPLCHDTTQFDVVARQAPLVDVVTNWTVCDDDTDGLFAFDLNQKDAEIYNGQDPTLFDILYFATQADADANTNPLPLPYTNTLPVEEVFFRFQNSTYTDCYRTGSFFIEVIQGVVANPPMDLGQCDDNNDGEAVFDLTSTLPEILGAQNAANLNITFHESQVDADTGDNAVNASNYLSTSYQNTIYVRVENASQSLCFDTTSFQLNIFDTPVVPDVEDWLICDDDNDGLHSFDLTQKGNEILGMTSDASVTFYETQTDADLAQNALGSVYQNTSNPQLLYFRLENTNNSNCYNVGIFELEVFDTPTAYPPTNVVVCDSDETGNYVFDLSQNDAAVLNGQDAQVYGVSYHSRELDALNNENPLSKTAYENTSLNETIWIRVEHAQLDFCYDVTSFNLLINPLPQPSLEEQYVICPDSPDLTIDGGDFETWNWKNENGTTLGNERTIGIQELGQYSLTVTQTQNGVSCENTVSFTVVSSGAPETLSVNTSGFSDVITLEVEATGIGDFEYSVDGITYQTDNVFEVFPGEYTVYVRDPFECRTLTEDIFVIGYQKFFTPNGDGANELWNIIGAENYPDSQLSIYDRYGKLIQQVSPLALGWDGTYQGNPLPASDYWFKFEYDSGKVITGHFSLKR